MEVNVAIICINIKVVTLFRGANVFRERRREIARGRGNISTGGEEIFPPPGDSVTEETLFRDTGTFSEKGWQEKIKRIVELFLTLHPLLLSLPTLEFVFVGQTAIVAHPNH